jgi:hypothetical protein
LGRWTKDLSTRTPHLICCDIYKLKRTTTPTSRHHQPQKHHYPPPSPTLQTQLTNSPLIRPSFINCPAFWAPLFGQGAAVGPAVGRDLGSRALPHRDGIVPCGLLSAIYQRSVWKDVSSGLTYRWTCLFKKKKTWEKVGGKSFVFSMGSCLSEVRMGVMKQYLFDSHA